MADLIQAWELQTYLHDDLAIVRYPDEGGPLPICVVEPREGSPEPDILAGETETVSLIQSGYVTRPPKEEWIEEVIVDIITRTTTAPTGQIIHRQIREALDGEKLFQLGDLLCEWIAQWRGCQKITSDATSHTFLSSYRIAARSKALAGLPYYP